MQLNTYVSSSNQGLGKEPVLVLTTVFCACYISLAFWDVVEGSFR